MGIEDINGVFRLFAAVVAYPTFTYAFSGYFDNKKGLQVKRYDASLLAFAFAFSVLLSYFEICGVSLSFIPACACTLCAARTRGFAFGGACGVLCGLVSGGVTYARDIIGGGAIAVVLSVVLSPLVTLFAYRLCLRLGSAVSSLCSLGGCEGVIDSFCGALDTVIAVYTLTSVIYIAELIAFLKGGVSLA